MGGLLRAPDPLLLADSTGAEGRVECARGNLLGHGRRSRLNASWCPRIDHLARVGVPFIFLFLFFLFSLFFSLLLPSASFCFLLLSPSSFFFRLFPSSSFFSTLLPFSSPSCFFSLLLPPPSSSTSCSSSCSCSSSFFFLFLQPHTIYHIFSTR